jgi:hypothetical protein
VLDDLKFRTAYVLCSARDGRMADEWAMVRRGNTWVRGCFQRARDGVVYGDKECRGEFYAVAGGGA